MEYQNNEEVSQWYWRKGNINTIAMFMFATEKFVPNAPMVELAYTAALEPVTERFESSSLSGSTKWVVNRVGTFYAR